MPLWGCLVVRVSVAHLAAWRGPPWTWWPRQSIGLWLLLEVSCCTFVCFSSCCFFTTGLLLCSLCLSTLCVLSLLAFCAGPLWRNCAREGVVPSALVPSGVQAPAGRSLVRRRSWTPASACRCLSGWCRGENCIPCQLALPAAQAWLLYFCQSILEQELTTAAPHFSSRLLDPLGSPALFLACSPRTG